MTQIKNKRVKHELNQTPKNWVKYRQKSWIKSIWENLSQIQSETFGQIELGNPEYNTIKNLSRIELELLNYKKLPIPIMGLVAADKTR